MCDALAQTSTNGGGGDDDECIDRKNHDDRFHKRCVLIVHYLSSDGSAVTKTVTARHGAHPVLLSDTTTTIYVSEKYANTLAVVLKNAFVFFERNAWARDF